MWHAHCSFGVTTVNRQEVIGQWKKRKQNLHWYIHMENSPTPCSEMFYTNMYHTLHCFQYNKLNVFARTPIHNIVKTDMKVSKYICRRFAIKFLAKSLHIVGLYLYVWLVICNVSTTNKKMSIVCQCGNSKSTYLEHEIAKSRLWIALGVQRIVPEYT